MSAIARPRMVALVREAKDLSQSDLAALVHHAGPDAKPVSQAFISKVEAGLLDLTGEKLHAVADALGCPVDLLTDDTAIQGLEVTCVHHRRRHSKIPASSKRRIEAVTHLTRVSVEGLLRGIELVPETQLQPMDIDEFGDPAAVARAARVAWRIPSGPIPNVLALLESLGVVIVVRSLGTRAQDAVSTWPHQAGRPPVMVLNEGLAPDRQRFTTSHELGHLLMHVVPSDEMETQADQFAAEFLAPAEEIEPMLADLTTRDLPRLLELKAHWGLSVAALIRRAKDVEVISDRQYREFQIKLRRLGWHDTEPNTLHLEKPATLDRVIEVHRDDHGYTLEELAHAALMQPHAFQRRYRPAQETPATTRLRLV